MLKTEISDPLLWQKVISDLVCSLRYPATNVSFIMMAIILGCGPKHPQRKWSWSQMNSGAEALEVGCGGATAPKVFFYILRIGA